jgi:hypothetical protein
MVRRFSAMPGAHCNGTCKQRYICRKVQVRLELTVSSTEIVCPADLLVVMNWWMLTLAFVLVVQP